MAKPSGGVLQGRMLAELRATSKALDSINSGVKTQNQNFNRGADLDKALGTFYAKSLNSITLHLVGGNTHIKSIDNNLKLLTEIANSINNSLTNIASKMGVVNPIGDSASPFGPDKKDKRAISKPSLKNVLDSINNSGGGGSSDEQDESTGGSDEQDESTGGSDPTSTNNDRADDLLVGSLERLKEAFNTNTDLDRKLLAYGDSLANAQNNAAIAYSDSSESLAGSLNTARLTLVSHSAGLGAMAEGTTTLLLSQKMLGQDMQALGNSLGKLYVGTGMNAAMQGELSNSILNLSQIFGIKVDVLTDALRSTSEIMGIGIANNNSADLLKGMAGLAAAAGPQMAEPMVRSMTDLLGPGGLVQASLLGVSQGRLDVQNGGDPTGLFIEASTKLEEQLKSIVQNSGDSALGLEVFNGMYGPNAMKMVKTLEGIKVKADEQGMTISEFMEQEEKANVEAKLVSTALDQIKGAFEAGFNFIITPIVGFVTEFASFFKGLLGTLGFIAGLITVTVTILGSMFAISKIGALWKKVTDALKVFHLTAISLTVGLVAIGILAIVAGIMWLVSSSKKIEQGVSTTAENTKPKDSFYQNIMDDLGTKSTLRFNLGANAMQSDLGSNKSSLAVNSDNGEEVGTSRHSDMMDGTARMIDAIEKLKNSDGAATRGSGKVK